MVCDTCGRDLPESKFNVDTRGMRCFGCHVKGIDLAFTHGRDNFHGPTFGELTAQAYKDAARTGEKIIPRTTVGGGAGAGGTMTKLGAILNKQASNGPS